MAEIDIPHSVGLFDSHSIAGSKHSKTIGEFSKDGMRFASEYGGRRLLEGSTPQPRTFALSNEVISFRPSEEIDALIVYVNGAPYKYAARNGVYVEIGNAHEENWARYDLSSGDQIERSLITPATPKADFTEGIDPGSIEYITQMCSKLRTPATPTLQDLELVSPTINQAFLRELSHQSPLFI